MSAPATPEECRRHAERALTEAGHYEAATAWALLGILGQLVEIEREMKRRR